MAANSWFSYLATNQSCLPMFSYLATNTAIIFIYLFMISCVFGYGCH
jgi:hypothetical protein